MKKALAVLLALVAMPLAAGDLHQLAQDLERALGRGKVEVHEPAPAPPRRSGVPARLSAESLLDAMNRERESRGLLPLRLNTRLSLAAEDRIDDMFAKRYFDHVAPDGLQPFVWASKRGYDYRTIGENLAVGYRSSAMTVDGWMHSAGHRKNILGPRFDEIGIAIALDSPTRRYAGPTVVALYASR